ncbi:hypothetical protein [Limnospira maxima]|nr:hypothetical protein [Limnospira maxima]
MAGAAVPTEARSLYPQTRRSLVFPASCLYNWQGRNPGRNRSYTD